MVLFLIFCTLSIVAQSKNFVFIIPLVINGEKKQLTGLKSVGLSLSEIANFTKGVCETKTFNVPFRVRVLVSTVSYTIKRYL